MSDVEPLPRRGGLLTIAALGAMAALLAKVEVDVVRDGDDDPDLLP